MKTRLCCLLCLSSMFWAPSLFAAGSILIEPFPAYSEEDPLVVESPITLRWNQGRELRIEVWNDDEVLFPRLESEGILDSGVSFLLDPGSYTIRSSEVRSAAPGEQTTVTHIYVPQTAQTIDMRANAAAVNVDMREVRRLLDAATVHDQAQSESMDAVLNKLDSISSQMADLGQQVADLQDTVSLVAAQFIVTKVNEDGELVIVDQPLQRVFDHVSSLEAPQAEKSSKP